MTFSYPDDNFYSTKNTDRDQMIIREVERILRDTHPDRAEWDVKICIDSAKVPVIKARYEPLGIQCELKSWLTLISLNFL
jgi:hypothetical protein